MKTPARQTGPGACSVSFPVCFPPPGRPARPGLRAGRRKLAGFLLLASLLSSILFGVRCFYPALACPPLPPPGASGCRLFACPFWCRRLVLGRGAGGRLRVLIGACGGRASGPLRRPPAPRPYSLVQRIRSSGGLVRRCGGLLPGVASRRPAPEAFSLKGGSYIRYAPSRRVFVTWLPLILLLCLSSSGQGIRASDNSSTYVRLLGTAQLKLSIASFPACPLAVRVGKKGQGGIRRPGLTVSAFPLRLIPAADILSGIAGIAPFHHIPRLQLHIVCAFAQGTIYCAASVDNPVENLWITGDEGRGNVPRPGPGRKASLRRFAALPPGPGCGLLLRGGPPSLRGRFSAAKSAGVPQPPRFCSCSVPRAAYSLTLIGRYVPRPRPGPQGSIRPAFGGASRPCPPWPGVWWILPPFKEKASLLRSPNVIPCSSRVGPAFGGLVLSSAWRGRSARLRRLRP